MKLHAAILILLISFLLVQPLLSAMDKPAETKCSSKAKKDCGETTDSNKEEKDCSSNRCNPFMSCATGNFYVVEGFYTDNNNPGLAKNMKLILKDDNRIHPGYSECWHPPEMV